MVTSPESRREGAESNSTTSSMCSGRCICLHAWSQWAGLALESLLLHHGLLSAPLQMLDEREAESATRLRDALRRTLKSRAHSDVTEVLIGFGASPISLTRLYRLPIAVCRETADESIEMDDEDTVCGSPCSALNANEQRKINRQLFQWFPPEAKPNRTVRAYIMVRGNDVLLSDDMCEIEAPPAKMKDGSIILEWTHSQCNRRLSIDERMKQEISNIHMRLKYFI